MKNQRMKIKDDRGIQHHGGKKFVRSVLAIRDFDRMRMIEKRIEQKSKKSTVISEMVCLLLLSLPFLSVSIVLLPRVGDFQSLPSLIFPCSLAVLGVLILLSAVTRPRTIRRERSKLAQELELYLSQFQGICLICKYELKGLPPEPDGCTVCPECGAAWRIRAEGA